MMEGLAVAAYRGVMTGAATVAGLAARLPGVPARWRAVGDRLGRIELPGEDDESQPALWLHAASVGELVAARPLLARLRERFPDRPFLVSTLTQTGLELARTLDEVDVAFLFPIDAPRTVRRLTRGLLLEAFLFTETEIWPTALEELAAAGVPTFMVSGRVSARTAMRGRWLRPVFRRALAEVTCCMQTDEDAQRIIALGADPRRVRVAGNLKFDGVAAEPPPDVVRLQALLRAGQRRMLVAGSTHEGEEPMLLEAFARVAPGHEDLVLLLAPRHPERFAAVAELITRAGWPLVRYTQLVAAPQSLPPRAVLLLDAVGPLAQCYALGVVAFVGGSLVPVGGHNVLEPARAARPVVVGPHTTNAADVVERLLAGGGALRVSSVESLAWALAGLLDEPGRAADMGRRARSLLDSGQGAVERHLKIIAARLTSARFAQATEGS